MRGGIVERKLHPEHECVMRDPSDRFFYFPCVEVRPAARGLVPTSPYSRSTAGFERWASRSGGAPDREVCKKFYFTCLMSLSRAFLSRRVGKGKIVRPIALQRDERSALPYEDPLLRGKKQIRPPIRRSISRPNGTQLKVPEWTRAYSRDAEH